MRDKRSVEGQRTEPGTLYIVSTPIGNLEDITLRALKILRSTDLIAAENTAHTRKLCSHFGIETRVTNYNQHNRKIKGPKLIEGLKKGLHIALVTNAGTPVISDPGALLVRLAVEEGIRVSPIPGPSAAIAALSVCALRVDNFLFLGFLSNRQGRRRKELNELKDEQRTMVFFEAPHRMESMLRDMKEILGDRRVVILRELTKVFEEIRRGHVGAILEGLDRKKLKGEFTVVVEGKNNEKDSRTIDPGIKKEIEGLLKKGGLGVKETAIHISKEHGLPYRAVYGECLALKRAMGKLAHPLK
jgi:16S rRNA (cytidine1402-2'-O)-methyltransferase